MSLKNTILLALLLLSSLSVHSEGTVYLVFGSDTAIWDRMSTAEYHCTYNLDLYTDPTENGYAAMDPAFRAEMVDSYGQPLKMTWWMMAGNIFRYATNNNVPVNNIMTMYLMQKYHGEKVHINGDELSLHYHTFFWSDYDQNGMYHWNQSLTFEESRDDWDVTLAQFLLEEDVFPVSFRSGWHYMDNDWQHELNDFIPYSMHNAWPTNRVDTEEPLDNTYNWSESPQSFVPFHPSLENYMVPGDGPGWNVRSSSFQHVISANLMDTVFYHASEGRDQLACFWAHLPEDDFVQNMATMNDMAHASSERYPGVDFKYCTAIEAMQLWQETADTIAPEISFEVMGAAGSRQVSISSNENLFMPKPFVAARYKDDSYVVLECESAGDNSWQITTIPFDSELAKIGYAATDLVGNLSTGAIRFVPDVQYIDNLDPGYAETAGTWTDHDQAAWGTDSRLAEVTASNPASVQWTLDLEADAYYHAYLQVAEHAGLDCPMTIEVESAEGIVSMQLSPPFEANQWIYLDTPLLSGSQAEFRVSSALPDSVASAFLSADVIKLSASVRERDLHVSTEHLNFGEVSQGAISTRVITLENRGIEPLTIQTMELEDDILQLDIDTPFTINPMSGIQCEVSIDPGAVGTFSDILHISSDDFLHAAVDVYIEGFVGYPFQLVDNEDEGQYEEWGDWATSVAVSYGLTSRYVYLGGGGSARYSLEIAFPGVYDISQIVPRTVNSADQALYIVKIGGYPVDSTYINQNEGSGEWRSFGSYYLPAGVPINVEVHDDGSSSSGVVLRADAIKLQMLYSLSLNDGDRVQAPAEFSLDQNYPNPFNPSTRIQFKMGFASEAQVKIFDLKGRLVNTLIDEYIPQGEHEVTWAAVDQSGVRVSAGVYLCQFRAAGETRTIKMLLLK